MTNTEFTLGRTTILVGDCRAALRTLPAQSIHCAVTSPPYYGLRDYGVAGQLGLETSVDAYINAMVDVFREVWRVLRDDGTLWLNIGDSYAGSGKGPQGQMGVGAGRGVIGSGGMPSGTPRENGVKAKSLMLIPFRLALALQADGWLVRSDIAWCKTAPMPESVTDRPTNAWEHIFLLTKRASYYYDAEAVRERSSGVSGGGFSKGYAEAQPAHGAMRLERPADNGTRNMWNYWPLSSEPFSEAHFATFPTEIPRRAILAGTSERGVCPSCGAGWVRCTEREKGEPVSFNGSAFTKGKTHTAAAALSSVGTGERTIAIKTTDWQPGCKCNAGEPIHATVLDPFGGSGTSAMVANRLQRNAILCELNPVYADMARNRIVGDLGMLASVDMLPVGIAA